MDTLLIGNLPVTATVGAVRALLDSCGIRVHRLLLFTDRATGLSCRYGFAAMHRADIAKAARALEGTAFEGRALTVRTGGP